MRAIRCRLIHFGDAKRLTRGGWEAGFEFQLMPMVG